MAMQNENKFVCRYNYRIYPTTEQIEFFQEQFAGMKYMYNRILDFADQNYEKTGNNQILAFSFATYKKEHPDDLWLKRLLSSAVNVEHQFAIQAYRNYYLRLQKAKKTKEHVSKPKRKSVKGDRNSFTIQTQNCTDKTTKGSVVLDWDNNTIKFPKIGIIKAVFHRRFVGCFKLATIIEDNGEYYISLSVTMECPQPLPKTGKTVGIALSKQDNLVVLSDGESYTNPKPGKKSKKRLRRLQRKLQRQQRVLVPDSELTESQKIQKMLGKPIYKDSKSRAKTWSKIQKLFSHDKHIRQDTAHKIALDVVRKFDAIGIKKQNIKGMVANPSDTSKTSNSTTAKSNQKSKPKRKRNKLNNSAIRKNHRELADASWGRITSCIKSKAQTYGKEVKEIDGLYPNFQICSKCGYQNKKIRDPRITHYTCPNCGAEHDRVLNAAINIRNRVLTSTDTVKIK